MQEVFEKIIERLENASFWTDSSFDEDGYCNDDSEEAVYLHEAIEIVKQEAEQYNNGWIPCSERLPEEDEKVYISTKTERVYVGVYTKRYGFEKREGFICDDGFMWMNTALAWKPYVLPAPYQPKGE